MKIQVFTQCSTSKFKDNYPTLLKSQGRLLLTKHFFHILQETFGQCKEDGPIVEGRVWKRESNSGLAPLAYPLSCCRLTSDSQAGCALTHLPLLFSSPLLSAWSLTRLKKEMERKEDAQWDEASIIRQKEDKRRGISTGMNTRGKVGKR